MQPTATPARNEALDATFAELRRVMAAMRGRFHRELAAHGLTFPQWFLVKSLRHAGRLTVKELADLLGVTPANVTGIVDRLERDGFVTRSRSSEDRRVVYVRLTESGHAKAAEILGFGARVLGDLFDGWSAADLAEFREMLARVNLKPGDQTEF